MPQLNCISLKTMRPMPMPRQTLLCLGNFDGVHLAHRALLHSAVEWRNSEFPEIAVGVFCFRELPSDSLSADPPGHLCSPKDRLERFASCGMEFAILADFSEMRRYSPETYIQEILIDACRCVGVACGFNHRFGEGGRGTPILLRRFFGSSFLLKEQVLDGDKTISSTRIRSLLSEGNPGEAARLLGEPYAIEAPVLHGKALGRRIGSPTLNQNFPEHAMIPRFGVYLTRATVDGRCYYGISNVGVRPTVDSDFNANCETFLLDFDGDLYDKVVRVSFLRFIRSEKRFRDVSELQAQITEDIRIARALLAELSE